MKLRDLVVMKAVIPQLTGQDRDAVIRELVDALVAAGVAPPSVRDELVKLILDRERKGSTGFGKGVAVPHVKHAKIRRLACAIGISPKGIDFRALDKAPVFTVMLLLSPADKPDEHLQAMHSLFANLQLDTFRRFLRQATTVQQVQELLDEADAHQLQG